MISRLIGLRLEPYGVTVVSAFFGTHGMWLAKQELPDVIITDYQMPQGNGGCVLEWLKANERTACIPVIVLTGRQEEGLETRLRQQGAAGFLRKPAPVDGLFEALGRFIHFEHEDAAVDPELAKP
jgi:CheY-like chemotaxis protein